MFLFQFKSVWDQYGKGQHCDINNHAIEVVFIQSFGQYVTGLCEHFKIQNNVNEIKDLFSGFKTGYREQLGFSWLTMWLELAGRLRKPHSCGAESTWHMWLCMNMSWPRHITLDSDQISYSKCNRSYSVHALTGDLSMLLFCSTVRNGKKKSLGRITVLLHNWITIKITSTTSRIFY